MINIDRIGFPPSTYVSDAEIENSMPVLQITPQVPDGPSGPTLFQLVDASNDYQKMLGLLGYSVNLPLKVAFMADSLPTDSFTNDYTETFLQKMTDVASQGISQLMQMSGAKTFDQGVQNISSAISAIGEQSKGMIGKAFGAAGGAGATMANEIKSLQQSLKSAASSGGGDAAFLSQAADTMNKMMGGHRIDYPKVWGNSAYSATYSINVKLYNPRPGNSSYTDKYIIGPLAALLCLSIPTSSDGYSYNWPFFHKVEAQGFFVLNPAVITNITVIKGGDQQQLAFTKTLGMVDVRIDFASLYESMVLETSGDDGRTAPIIGRPTVLSYLKTLKRSSDKVSNTRAEMRKSSEMQAGVTSLNQSSVRASFIDPKDTAAKLSAENLIEKNIAAGKRQVATFQNDITNGVTRVSDAVKSTSLDNVTQNKEFILDVIRV
jgi:hypothetical protein